MNYRNIEAKTVAIQIPNPKPNSSHGYRMRRCMTPNNFSMARRQ